MTQLTSARGLAWETVALPGSAGATLRQYTRLVRAVQGECLAAQQRVLCDEIVRVETARMTSSPRVPVEVAA